MFTQIIKTTSLSIFAVAALVGFVLLPGSPVEAQPPIEEPPNSEPPVAERPGSETPIGGNWALASLVVNGEQVELPDTPIGISITANDIGGYDGCNQFSAALEAPATTSTSGTVALGQIIATRAACFGDVFDFNEAYVSALTQIDKWELDQAGTLTISGNSAELTYTNIEEQPTPSYLR